MASVYIDRIDVLEVTERLGAVRALTRKARVIFADVDIPGDYTVLWATLNDAGIPLPRTGLTAGSASPDGGGATGNAFNPLVLIERHATIVDQDPGTVDVTLKYEHYLDGPNQDLFNPSYGILYGKGRCSVVQLPTNFYYPFGDRTQPRQQILVGHTFPLGSQLGSTELYPNFPGTYLQGGEVNIPFPQSEFSMEGVTTIKDLSPFDIENQLVPTMNSKPWLGKPAFTWLCSEVTWESLDPEQSLYRFGFKFQNNIDTWNTTVVFKDERTGNPPSDVVFATANDSLGVKRLAPNPRNQVLQAAGAWQVPYLQSVDYDAYFAAYFEGIQFGGGG